MQMERFRSVLISKLIVESTSVVICYQQIPMRMVISGTMKEKVKREESEVPLKLSLSWWHVKMVITLI